MNLKYVKIGDVKDPSYSAGDGNAGIDFYIPDTFIEQTLLPNDDILIPSGIKCNIPIGHALIAFNKSGVATKKKGIVGACVVDESYLGEIHIHIFNNGNDKLILSPGEKIVQFILVPITYAKIIKCKTEDDCFAFKKTKRGDKGFGSTGTK